MGQGFLQGFTYPACHTAMGLWVPVKERSKLSVIIYSGKMSYYITKDYVNCLKYFLIIMYILSIQNIF